MASIPAPPADTSGVEAGTLAGRILFDGDATQLTGGAKDKLDALARKLGGNPHLYLQLDAFAGGSGDGSQARRLALSRALAARDYLIDRGVDAKQVDVRPLGNHSKADAPPDRIDAMLFQR